jgi:hypothetical protein
MCPVGQGPLASSSGQNGTPRHSWGLTTRTRRPRPSEKFTLRIVSRSSPQGHPSLHSPPRGGAGSARPQRGHWLRGGYSPLGSRPLAHASGGNGMPWRSFSLAMRTHRVRPSEKSGFGTVPWFAPVRPSSHRLAIWRRGGLRTPGGRHRLDRGMSPLGHGYPPRVMKCLGMSKALPCGRTECVPPRKAALAPSPGLPP